MQRNLMIVPALERISFAKRTTYRLLMRNHLKVEKETKYRLLMRDRLKVEKETKISEFCFASDVEEKYVLEID